MFNSVRLQRPRLNKFNLSHERKFTLDMGKLYPILVQDILPGDKFRLTTEVFIRLAPMIAPVMHRMNVFCHFFFVPDRLIWDEFPDWVTGGREGTTNPNFPRLKPDTDQSTDDLFQAGSLGDYMGLSSHTNDFAGVTQFAPVSALPFRAYQLIYDEYYRDQNLQASLDISKASGDISPGAEYTKLVTMRKRAWEKDYFTSALPWAQRGGEVIMPVEVEFAYRDGAEGTIIRNSSDGSAVEGADLADFSTQTGTPPPADGTLLSGAPVPVYVDNIESIDGTSVSINELRRAVRLQEWLEKNARGGARYIEQILSHFGVRSSDARLQRPEFLGGGKTPVVISDVMSTTEFEGTGPTNVPQGNMAGRGISVGNQNGFSRSFEEHGQLIGIMSILPRTAYQQGIPRSFRKFDKFDRAWPEFANLGEQEVKLAELYYKWDTVDPDELLDKTFGYQSRYAEYKYIPSTVHGDFKGSLNYWHDGRIFENTPVLNESFVMSDPSNRIFAVTDISANHFYCQLYHNISALRPLPYYGTPIL